MLTKMFRENYQHKTLEELVDIRREIIKKLEDYENKFIYNKPDEGELFAKPSPHTIYSVSNEDLILITELIIEKRISV